MSEQHRETIYLVGTSGYPNFGDEFIAAAWLRFLARARPDADVWLDCQQPGLASHLFQGLHPRLHTTDALWRLVRETASWGRPEADEHIARRIQHLGTPGFDLGLMTLRRASTLHFIGGGHLAGLWPAHVGLLRAGTALLDLVDVRVVATGLGVAPVPPGETLLNCLKRFDHVTVRDAQSAEATGADLAPDDAFLAAREVAAFGSQPAAQDGDVWVCLQHDLAEPRVFDAIIEATRHALRSPSMAGRTVRYLEAIPGVDRVAYERLADLIPEEHFLPFARLWHEGLPARPGQTWLTTRFHLHLLAAASGAAGTAIEIDAGYYRVKHGSLFTLGTGWSVTPAGSVTVADPAVSQGFPYAARLLAHDKLQEAQQLYPASAPPSGVAHPPAQRRPRLLRRV